MPQRRTLSASRYRLSRVIKIYDANISLQTRHSRNARDQRKCEKKQPQSRGRSISAAARRPCDDDDPTVHSSRLATSSISFTVPLVKPLCFTQRAVTRVRTRCGTTEMEICSAPTRCIYTESPRVSTLRSDGELWLSGLSRARVSLRRRYFEIKGHSARARARACSLNERNYMFIVLRAG